MDPDERNRPMADKITITKEQGDYGTQWCVELGDSVFCDIEQQRERYAHATSRAAGTRVEGYWVTFADGRQRAWFDANECKSARKALAAATSFALEEASKKGGRA
jgi:hypothetical protein